jgi:hypothetical protein
MLSCFHQAYCLPPLGEKWTEWLSKLPSPEGLLAVQTSPKKQLLFYIWSLLPKHMSQHFSLTADHCSLEIWSHCSSESNNRVCVWWSFSPAIASAPSRRCLPTRRSCTRLGLSRGEPDRLGGRCKMAATTTMLPADQTFRQLGHCHIFTPKVQTFYWVHKIW